MTGTKTLRFLTKVRDRRTGQVFYQGEARTLVDSQADRILAGRDADGNRVAKEEKDAELTSPHAEKTVAELREYATEHGVDLGGATKKDEILAAIDAAE